MLQVIKNRKVYYIISGVLFLFSLFSIFFIKLNLWIDMTGGTQTEYTYTNSIEIDDIRSEVEKLTAEFKKWSSEIINSTQVYKITWENKFAIIAWFNTSWLSEKELEEYKIQFKSSLYENLKKIDTWLIESQYINIWKSFWDYIKNTAIITLILAIIGIAIYVSYAFSWIISWINSFSFSWVTIITLFHDVFIASGLYIFISLFFKEFQIDTFFITALLTILGYSINDTIVVFDRIRTNLEIWVKKKNPDLKEIVDNSINETLTRSIYTSLTLFIVLVAIFFWGPEAIKGFTLVMIFGTVVGTYSSIFIAAPLLYDINKNKELKVIEKKTYNPDDKIVV